MPMYPSGVVGKLTKSIATSSNGALVSILMVGGNLTREIVLFFWHILHDVHASRITERKDGDQTRLLNNSNNLNEPIWAFCKCTLKTMSTNRENYIIGMFCPLSSLTRSPF